MSSKLKVENLLKSLYLIFGPKRCSVIFALEQTTKLAKHISSHQSSDFNTLNIFLCNYMKKSFYKNKNSNFLSQTKCRNDRAHQGICNQGIENFSVKLNACMNQNKGNIKHFFSYETSAEDKRDYTQI